MDNKYFAVWVLRRKIDQLNCQLEKIEDSCDEELPSAHAFNRHEDLLNKRSRLNSAIEHLNDILAREY
jgi:hypothetical protein